MKSAEVIRYDFYKALNEAEDLENAARKMRSLSESDMENTKFSMGRVWKGEASDVYQRKFTQLQEKILDSAKDLEKQASAIRSMARRTYEAEMQAYRLATDRNN